MLGVKKGKVKLEKYNPSWKDEFEKEKKELDNLIGNYVISIEHVGSTSIPGMIAKPIIDMAIIVKKLKNDNKYIKILIENGYEYRDDNGAKGEQLFKKINEKGLTTHFLHVIEENGKRHKDYMLFKKYLLKHEEEIEKYCELKQKLYEKYKNEREKYTQAKDKYINTIISKSKEENN